LAESQAYFDLNGDGFATRTAWLSSDDGFLALDRNEDGTINDINELFGSSERTGYEELTDLDSNSDGVIDAHDARFADLDIWQDLNGDGISQADELRSLSDVGIASISLDHEQFSVQAEVDAQIASQGTFQWYAGTDVAAGGTTGIAAEVLFASNPTFTRYIGNVELDPEVLAVGNIKGYGQMLDLHSAMSRDTGLKDTVLDLFNAPTATSLIANFDDLLVKWAGVENITLDHIDPNHRLNVNPDTGQVDFRLANESFTLEQLGIIKQYAGLDVLRLGDGQWREEGQLVTTGGYYRQAYDMLSRNLLVKVAVANGILSDIMPGLTYDPETDLLTMDSAIESSVFDEAFAHIGSSLDNPEAITQQWIALTALLEIDPASRSLLTEAVGRFVASFENPDALLPTFENPVFEYLRVDLNLGTSGADTLTGGNTDDVIAGFSGDDRLYGQAGDDVFDGGEGRDSVYGGNGNDTLRGGTGSGDYLSGDAGNDTYLFGIGDGNTTIYNRDTDTERQDVLRFLEGVDPADVVATRSSSNLLLTVQSTGEVITVQSYFYQDGDGGYALNAIEFADGTRWDVDIIRDLVLQATDGADTLIGYDTDDVISGLDGNDTLQGGNGADFVLGGAGNDYADGGNGADFVLGGDGNDRVYGQNGDDMLSGGDGDDAIYGGAGDDVLYGGEGRDYLSGDSGNDTYFVGVGDGNTTIYNRDIDTERQDVLRFLEGVDPADVVATRSSSNLLLTVQSTGEVVTVQSHFYQDGEGGYAINAVEFADGTRWDAEALKDLVQQGTIGADSLYGYAGDDVLDGQAGNDTLYGADGNDTLSGGEGNDYLYGNEGNDVITGDAGNDHVYGQNGDDVLDGGEGRDSVYGGNGNDILRGGTGNGDYLSGDAGNDTYLIGIGDGNTTISNYDTEAASVDSARFEDVSMEDLWFSRSGNNLQITVAGTEDRVTISSWYSNTNYQLDQIEVGSSVLLNNQVDQLVSAMASYSVPSGVGNVIPQEVKDDLQPILAETWQTVAA
jgi:Ca2+-binding RTX toxin-like protein